MNERELSDVVIHRISWLFSFFRTIYFSYIHRIKKNKNESIISTMEQMRIAVEISTQVNLVVAVLTLDLNEIFRLHIINSFVYLSYHLICHNRFSYFYVFFAIVAHRIRSKHLSHRIHIFDRALYF